MGALVMQESGGRHRDERGELIESPAGALGITQVTPPTAASPGFGVRPLQDDTEEEYLRFGRDYLAALLRRYGGDERKALAAYNAGHGAVDEAVAKAEGAGGDWLALMPEETRQYVPSVLAGARGG